MITVLVSLPWAACVAAFLVASHKREVAHREQVDMLLQRIQAPEVAVAQHIHATDGPSLGYVPVDDDDRMADEFRMLTGG